MSAAPETDLLIDCAGCSDVGRIRSLNEDRFLLPVVGVPADPANSSGNRLADVVAPDTAAPVAVTVLWPLADKPRLAPGAPGGTTPVRLMNDDLAVSLAPVGSDMQDSYETPDEPEFDLTGFDLAPVGADLDTTKKEAPPPPPDTTGLSLEE